ncbi:restriction endonuclease subunit S [Photobacterium leiognathi]|uniref:restriction endonuclease subunit S n=1 Tax=Photobacterium leiognathi TaxID=553611 RepID=UPI002982615C|nr:restriction endonuclease subunit S [Photobacterium leiognathi]
MDIKIDKSSWKKVRLGDVATEYSKRVNNPSESGLERFVGNSNIGQWDFRIKDWESTSSVTSAMKLFEPDDYLLVRRSLYASDFRERAPRAHFAGVCSGDILTIRENPEYIADGFLIGILNSPALWKHVVANASGSITRRIKWKDLASYEFLLPPKDKQVELAKLLWTMEETIEKEFVVLKKLTTLRDINREKLYTYGIEAIDSQDKANTKVGKSGLIRTDFKELKFFDCVEIKSGQVDPKDEKYSGLIQIGSERIDPNTGRINEYKTAEELNITSGNYLFTEQDIIYSKIRPYFKKVAVPDFTGLCSADIYPLRLKSDSILKEYLFYFMLTEKFTRKLLRFQNRTGMPKVNRDELSSMYVPFPTDKNEQMEIVSILKNIDGALDSVRTKIDSSKSLEKSIINQVF